VDVGDLRDVPDPPAPPVGTLFVPRDAGGPAPAEVPTVAPVATPIAPLAPSPAIPELAGNGSLTLLHGVVDAASLSFCVVVTTPEETVLSVKPMPAGGLAYGQALVLPLDESIDLAVSELRTVAVATPRDGSDEDCAELLTRFGHALPDAARGVVLPHTTAASSGAGAVEVDGGVSDAGSLEPADGGSVLGGSADGGSADGGPFDGGSADAGHVAFPALRTAELPRLLPGTFDDRSYLLVATGCLGAPGLEHPDERAICGPGFTQNRATFAGVFVALSRLVDFGSLGLQFVHASQALGELTLRSDAADTGGTSFTVATAVVLGEIAPYSARRSLTVENIGAPLEDVVFELSSSPDGSMLGTQPWSLGVDPNRIVLENGRAYTVVLIGPGVGADDEAWWNPPRLTLVANDPLDD
jgi:hypothetical protein